ncbi:MAG: glycosyltransferase family 2 protein [Phycisphaeraceae bacterium]
MQFWITASLIALWTAWVTQAALCVLQAWKLMRRLEKEPHGDHWGTYGPLPRCWLLVPFKGADDDLPACLRSLCTQQYPDYRLRLLVESPADPAYAVLQTELASYPHCDAQIMVTGVADEHESQKVHNQIAALRQLDGQADDADYWVFADSDAVPGPQWLRSLAGPLIDPDNGMTTSYRWLVPGRVEGGKGRVESEESNSGSAAAPPRSSASSHPPRSTLHAPPTIWSQLASVMNSSAACVYRGPLTSLAWGGAMAVPVRVARAGGLIDALRGSFTDDLAISGMVRRMGKRVWFVSHCLAPSAVDFGLVDLAAFARRQYMIVREFEPLRYIGPIIVFTLWVLGFVTAWLALLLAAARGASPWVWGWPLAAIVTVAVCNQLRAGYRRRVVRLALGDPMAQHLRIALLLDRWCTPVWMTLHWGLMMLSLFGNRVRWRGVRYRIDGPHEVTRISEKSKVSDKPPNASRT